MFCFMAYQSPLIPRIYKPFPILSFHIFEFIFSHLIINPPKTCMFTMIKFSQKGQPTALVFLCQYQTS